MSSDKTHDIGQIIQRLKLAENFRTDKEVAAFLGVSGQALSLWLKRNSQTPVEKILYRTKGKIRERWLLTGEGPMLETEGPGYILSQSARMAVSPQSEPPKTVPLISWVQAGDWNEVTDPYPPGYAERWVKTFETDHPNAFALTVVGDSMQPEFTDGDIIIVDPGLQPQSGDHVIAKNGESATFKQLLLDGSSVLLKPLNDRYPIKDVTGQPVRIVGVVVGKQKKYRGQG